MKLQKTNLDPWKTFFTPRKWHFSWKRFQKVRTWRSTAVIYMSLKFSLYFCKGNETYRYFCNPFAIFQSCDEVWKSNSTSNHFLYQKRTVCIQASRKWDSRRDSAGSMDTYFKVMPREKEWLTCTCWALSQLSGKPPKLISQISLFPYIHHSCSLTNTHHRYLSSNESTLLCRNWTEVMI